MATELRLSSGRVVTDAGVDVTADMAAQLLEELGVVVPPAVGDYVMTRHLTRTTGVVSTGVARFVPVTISRRTRFDRIAAELVTASANSELRLGVYAHDETTARPGRLILDAGTVDGTGSTGVLTITIDLTLDPGTYWLVAVSQGAGAGATWRLTAGEALVFGTVLNGTNFVNSAFVQTGIAGALPNPAVVSNTNLNGIAMQIRRASDPT